MKIGYKFWYILRDDNDFITEANIRIYEGKYEDIEELNVETDKLETVNRYVRKKRLRKIDTDLVGNKTKLDKNGNEALVYTAEDFGAIKTDDELRCFLNGEIKKDKGREPLDVQTETELDIIKLLKIK